MPALTLLHVVISLIAIGAGFPLLAGLLAGRHSGGTAMTFLVMTFLTSLTGFLVATFFLALGAVAGLLPARRAAGVDPVTALRAD